MSDAPNLTQFVGIGVSRSEGRNDKSVYSCGLGKASGLGFLFVCSAAGETIGFLGVILRSGNVGVWCPNLPVMSLRNSRA